MALYSGYQEKDTNNDTIVKIGLSMVWQDDYCGVIQSGAYIWYQYPKKLY